MNSNRMLLLTQEPLLRILGPLFLIGAIGAAAVSGHIDLPLVAVGAFGLFLCARWEVRGFGYSLALLLVAGLIGHFWGGSNHWWRLGLEGSIGSALLLTALAFEEGTRNSNALLEQIEARKQTIGNLEDELLKKQTEFSQELISAQEKFSSLQHQFEDSQIEASTLQVLNEVLRKQSAKLLKERDVIEADRLDLERRFGQMQLDLTEQIQENQRICNSDALKKQNEQLFKELNEARIKEEQTKLINETLVRIHAKESSELEQISQEKLNLQEMVQMKDQEIAFLQERSLDLFTKESSSQNLLLKLEGEKEFYKDRLEKLQPELDLKESRIQLLQEQMQHLQQSLADASANSALYRQLKAQFLEKDEHLKSARADRFIAETHAKTLECRIQELEMAPEPFSSELRFELTRLESEIKNLSEENFVLEEIVSSLSEVKKKGGSDSNLSN